MPDIMFMGDKNNILGKPLKACKLQQLHKLKIYMVKRGLSFFFPSQFCIITLGMHNFNLGLRFGIYYLMYYIGSVINIQTNIRIHIKNKLLQLLMSFPSVCEFVCLLVGHLLRTCCYGCSGDGGCGGAMRGEYDAVPAYAAAVLLIA